MSIGRGMRRIALIGALAASLLLAGAAEAQHHGERLKDTTVQIHNTTREDLLATAHVRGSITHHLLFPLSYWVIRDVDRDSCVRVGLDNPKKHIKNPCERTSAEVSFACDLPSDFTCVFHAGVEKDVVVTIRQFPRR